MADKMLIDATHPEETRVVVVRGNRVEEFDFESANRKQLRGNIYLAKVTRVEPSLQAAFVEYGGNRHGFLAFSEIHPDYYQIPVADRQALIAQEEREVREAEEDHDRRGGERRSRHRQRGAHRNRDEDAVRSAPAADEHAAQPENGEAAAASETAGHEGMGEQHAHDHAAEQARQVPTSEEDATSIGEVASNIPDMPAPELTQAAPNKSAQTEAPAEASALAAGEAPVAPEQVEQSGESHTDEDHSTAAGEQDDEEDDENGEGEEEEAVESVGGADALEEVQERVPRFRRQYKIQEVIKRRQVMLVQVVKEERGTKGAALTTYLSLAGRYSVLMPNTPRGGGISRKITSAEDRSRLKEIAQELEVPEGMGVILRTAGANRTKTEVKRDFEYLLRLWETVRDLTLKSMAPTLVYEEGSLIKRSIRDLYNKDIDEIIVAGDEGYSEARDFMRMLMPSHVKSVIQYKDNLPLFTRYGIESQLDAMFSPVVQLKSGGYIVINQAEALVAIDVNSGRATREHHIEDTALKTNVEAAEEIARQLRLRDLAGLIVIDFIDMDEGRNNRHVERRMKEALKHDRARIQVGRISHFGLLEMSRQRIRSSVLESSTEKCPVCGGSGHVRSVSSVALQLLRAVEETLNKGATHNLIVRTRSEVALYVLNHKRAHLRMLEQRFRITITISADETVTGQQSYLVERGEQVHSPEAARQLAQQMQAEPELLARTEENETSQEEDVEEAEETTETEEAEGEAEAETEGPAEARANENDARRRRRRRGGRGRGRDREREPRAPREGNGFTQETVAEHAVAHEDHDAGTPEEADAEDEPQQALGGQRGEERDGNRRRRRRGRRGGRRNRPHDGDAPLGSNGGPESDLQHSVDDMDGGPPIGARNHEERAPEPRQERPVPTAAPEFPPPPAPTPQPAATASAPAAARSESAPAEAPRRRSTIREPAPIGRADAPIPVPVIPTPEPVLSSTAPEPATPKRGWWGKRLLGGK
jgi:ribonuclease E